MSGWSIPVLVMAGITAYVGATHLLVYLRVRRREHLAFAVLCAGLVGYDLLCAGLYSAESPPDAGRWQVGLAYAVAVSCAALVWFVAEYLDTMRREIAAGLVAVAAPLLACLALAPRAWLVTDTPLTRQVDLPFGLSATFHEMAVGPLFAVENLLAIASIGLAMVMAARRLRTPHRSRAVPLLAATAIFLPTAASDVLASAGVYSFVYLAEYGFGALVVLMTFRLTSELARTAAAERELAESDRSRREIFNATGEAIFVFDADTGATVDVNQAVLDMFGYARAEAMRLSVADLSTSTTGSGERIGVKSFAEVAARGSSVVEGKARRADGGELWIEVTLKAAILGGRSRVLAVVRDITGRKRAEEALRASQRFNETIVGAIPGVVYIWDLEAQRPVYVNQNVGELLGYSPEEIAAIGEQFLAHVVHPDDLETVAGLLARWEEVRDDQVLTSEYRVRARNGELRWWLGRDRVLKRGPDGRVSQIIGSVHDITERRQAEAERERLEGQLRQSQKMEAVGRLAGGVAHDFNNLLQAILGYAEILATKVSDPEAVREGLSELAENAMRGARLTRQLLVFSRREATSMENLDLGTVVAESALLVRRLLRESVRLEVHRPSEELPIRADRGQLEQVVMNLAVNAADAMSGGGVLTVRTGDGNDGRVWLEVADTGHGIPEDVLEHIFDPFFTTKPAAEGTGLGLSVVHAIVAQHQGTVDVESTLGVGTTFRVHLPRRQVGSAGAKPGASPLPAGLTGGGRRVLLVEDEAGARQVLAESLSVLGFEVVAVSTIAAARSLPTAPGFSVLLCDVVLPDGAGNELVGELRARWPRLAVVLMSGYAQEAVLRSAVLRGDIHFLQKPFGLSALVQELSRALAAVASAPVQ